ncbi:MAG: 50S ribosomal protein L1 [Planctomycetes bacterium]|nr:50S ribosomal protein L1 [Planctomycetota bacterium]
MAKKSKKYRRNRDKAKTDPLPLPEAVVTLKKFENAKFDETVEVAVKLGIDPKNTAQTIRGAFSLPHGIGRAVRVIAFAEGEAATAAKEAGADEVGAEDLAKKIQGGWMDFDVAVAHPSMMRHVGKLGRILGPHGKMPSPKSGTVTDNIGQVVREFKAGKVEFRNDDGGNVHAVVGKKSFPPEKLVENISAFLDHLRSIKPPAAKGNYVQKIAISATMSPGVRVVV